MKHDPDVAETPSGKSAAILALARKGLRPAEIAPMIGSTPNAVQARISQLRRMGHRIPHLYGAGIYRIPISEHVLNVLDYEAAARGLSHPDLAGRILDSVLSEGLIDAVLDDRGS